LRCFSLSFFFFQAEDGIRDGHVTGVQTCALPISAMLLHLLSLRGRLHDYMAARPAGATAEELLDLVFVARGRDPDFGDRFLAALLGADPRFRFDPVEQRWRVRACDGLLRSLAEVE